MKYRVGSGQWLHAFLDNSGHNTGTGTAATITPGLMNTANAFNATTNPAMGAFVHRSGNGSGAFTQTSMQLRWNYGANTIADSYVNPRIYDRSTSEGFRKDNISLRGDVVAVGNDMKKAVSYGRSHTSASNKLRRNIRFIAYIY